MYPGSLCNACHYVRKIENKRGSVFYLCGFSRYDPRFLKYPPQPVQQCSGYRPATDDPAGPIT